tara:strand:- start:1 stop:339 length:339 start_codon:yes stop_codon:yes gene_type:complete
MELLAIIGFTTFSALIDYEHLKDNDYIESHLSRSCLRAIFIIAVGYNNPIAIVGMTLMFMALFDGALNTLRGKELFYLGNTALWDRFWSRIPYLYMVMKVVSLFVGIYLCLA